MEDEIIARENYFHGGGTMGEMIRSKDWSSTSLGDPVTWPINLRNSVSLLLNSQFAMFIWWGPDMITFYNDAYMQMLGKKHPDSLGSKGFEVWEEIWPDLKPLVDKVMIDKESVLLEDMLLYVKRYGYTEPTYFTYSYSPVLDESGEVEGLFAVVTETTQKVIGTRKILESEQNFRNLVTEAPIAICILTGEDYIVEMANEVMLQFLGRTKDIIGQPLLAALPEADMQGLTKVLDHVRQTGESFSKPVYPAELLIDGVRETRYFDLIFKPHYKNADSSEVTSIFCVAHNVTEEVLIRRQLEENESDLQRRVEERTADLNQQRTFIESILDASFNGIYSLKAVRNQEGIITDFHYLFANKNIANLVNLQPQEMIGASMLQLIPENKNNGFFDLFCRVLQTGKPVQDVTHFVTQNIDNWYDYVIVPIDSDTVVVTTQDITKNKLASIQIEEQRNLLDNIMKHSPSGISVTEVIRNKEGTVIDGRTLIANEISEKFTGIPLAKMLHNTVAQNDPGVIDSPLFQQAVHTLNTGVPFIMQYFLQGAGRWLELSVARMDKDRLINVFTDVTATKTAELEIVNSIERLAGVFNAAQSGMFTFAPEFNEEGELIDFRFVITNANFAAYVNQTPEGLKGELGSTWFPSYMENGVFDMYKKTFLTGETQRQNIHYNADGLDVYLDLMSTKIMDEVLVTFTDYTELKLTQTQLEQHIEELKRSNANLEEFAHAASHDLKEPIRKVQVFSDRLKSSFNQLTEEQQNLFGRVDDAAQRMSLLIDDLLDYSHVSMGVEMLEEIDLNEKLETVISDLEIAIQDKDASIKVDPLPTIKGHRRQLQQLFHNLIQNALKYSKKDEAPHISITSEKIKGREASFTLPFENNNHYYHLIQVKDNGIGFDQEYAERIFQMFQRLHGKSEYNGSGVGLAIVRKVVQNHNGHIAAESVQGQGATFKILFPAE